MGTATAKNEQPKTDISHIKLTKCKIDLIQQELKNRQQPAGGKLMELVLRLATWYKQNQDQVELADCDVCGAESDANLDACPYCGTGGVVTTDGTPVQAAGDGPGDEEHDEGDPESEELEDEDDDAEIEGTGEEGEQDEAPEDSEADVVKTTKTRKQAKDKAKATKAAAAPNELKQPKAQKGQKAKPAEAPDAGGTTTAIVSSQDLDAQVQVIRHASQEGAVNMHRIGVALNKINDEGLWKLRSDPKTGVPLYKSFKQFCTEELKATPQHAYRCMDGARQFKEDEVRTLSGAQLRIIMALPSGKDREELLGAARQGEGKHKLTERANALRGKSGAPAKPSAAEASKQVTVAVTQGHHKLKMYKAPTTGGGRVGETEGATRAKRLADMPWAVMELSNKVRLIVRVGLDKNGEVAANIEFRRGVPAI